MQNQPDPLYVDLSSERTPLEDVYAQRAERNKIAQETSFGDAYDAAVESTHSAIQVSEYFKAQGRDVPITPENFTPGGIVDFYGDLYTAFTSEGFEADPNFDLDATRLLKDMESAGLDPSWASEFVGIESEQHYQARLNYLKRRQEQLSIVASAGGKGIAAMLAASFSDPATFAAEAAAAPLALAGKGTRMGRLLKAGLYGGSANAAIGSAQGLVDPEYGLAEVMTDMAAGAVIGTVLSAPSVWLNPDEIAESERMINRMARMFGNETFGADSAGAARIGSSQVDTALDTTLKEHGAKNARQNIIDNLDLADVESSVPSWMRIDQMSAATSHVDPEVRTAVRLLHSDAVGVKGDTVNTAGATERAKRHQYTIGTMFFRGYNNAYKEWAESQGISWLKREFHTKTRDDFARRVGRHKLLGSASQETDPAILKAAGEMERTMQEIAKRANQAGVRGAENMGIQGYMPRLIRNDIREVLAKKLGSDLAANERIEDLIAGGIDSHIAAARRAARADLEAKGLNEAEIDLQLPKWDPNITRRVAKVYTDRVFGNEPPGGGVAGVASARLDELDDVLQTAGVPESEIQLIMKALDVMGMSKKDPAASSRLKSRLQMDMSYYIDTANGERLYLADLFDDHAEQLTDNYIREMSGHIGAGEVGFADVKEMFQVISGKLQNDDDVPARRALEAIVKSLIGRPLEDVPYSTSNRAARMMMDYNFLRTMGSVAWSMMAENGKILGLAGARATLKQIPAMASIAKQIKSGNFDSTVARQLAAMSGIGSTVLRSSVALRPDDLNLPGLSGKLGAIDRAQQVAKRMQALASGLGPLNDIQQMMSGMAFSQRLYDAAMAGGRLPKAFKRRLYDYGVSDAEISAIMKHLKTHAKAEGGVLKDLGDAQMSPALQEAYGLMVSRMARHVIQDLDIGATPWFMNKMLGKLLFQFRSFSLGAYTRHTLHGVAHADATLAASVAYSAMFATAAYYGRAYVNFAGDPERLEKALEEQNVAKSVVSMIAEFGFVPLAVDTMMGAVGEDPVFSYNRSSDLATGFITGNPSFDTMSKLRRVLNIPVRVARGDQDVTEEDVRAFTSLLWFNKLPIMNSAFNAIPPNFPKEREVQQGKWLD